MKAKSIAVSNQQCFTILFSTLHFCCSFSLCFLVFDKIHLQIFFANYFVDNLGRFDVPYIWWNSAMTSSNSCTDSLLRELNSSCLQNSKAQAIVIYFSSFPENAFKHYILNQDTTSFKCVITYQIFVTFLFVMRVMCSLQFQV